MVEKSRDQSRVSPITDVLANLQATSRWQEHVYTQLHSHPELSFQETRTAALAASKLKELGYEVLEGIGQTGVVGVLRNGGGQTVLAPLAVAGRARGFRREIKMNLDEANRCRVRTRSPITSK